MKATHSAVLVLGAVLAVAAGAEPSQSMKYTVLAPISVRPNSEYAVVVTMHDGDKDTTVHLELVSQDPDANRTYSQDVVVPPNSSKTVRMQVGDLGGGNITLSARGGEGDGRWSNSTKLQLATKNASLLIQTDKALYKPGQEVRIRVLALDPRLRPTVHDPLDIHITDGKGNRIKQWAAEHTRNGIWSTVLQLSEQPVMGDWTVTASLPGSSSVNKKFSVAEYVLPTFEVSVKAPAVVSFKHGKVVVTVDAKYTYGKPVVGKATVRAPLPYYWVWEHLQPLPPIDLISGNNASTTTTTTTSTTPAAPRPSHIEKTVPIDGTATVEFDLTEELRLRDSVYWNQVEFEAWAVEELTGRRQNASGSVNTQIRKEDFNIDFVDTPNDFVPGQLFIAKVKVSDLEGAPVQDAENTVLLQTRKSWADNLTTLAEKKVPSNGIVTFEIETKKDAGELNLVATYKESEASHYAHQKRKEQESEEDLYIKVAKESVKVGDDVELVITSKVALQKVTLLVIGPLGLREVQSLGLEGEEGKRKVAARVKVTDGMVPASRVLVHGVKDNGDLITDVTAFKVTGFTPAVEVRVEPGRSQPGHDVTLQVAAKPNATVALLAVDQSVLLLKDASNAITLDELHTERLSYESLTESSWGYSGPGAESLVGGWRGWNDSPEESFKKAGLAYLTNVKIPKRQVTYYLDGLPGGVAFGAPAAAGAIGPLAVSAEAMRPQFAPMAPSAASGGAAPPPRLRTLFPETWLWQELDSGADGNVSLKTVVPDTITSWVVSALAVDPVHGLGLSNTSKLTVFRPFFASLSLPYSVIRGETVEVPVLVFNYMDEPTTATVTMHNPRDEFDFVEPKTSQRGRREAGEGEKTATRTVDVPAQSSAAVSFNITTKKVGNVLLKVTALAKDKAGDALERPLKVKAEGEPQYRNKAIPIDLRKQKEFKTTVKIDMPAMVPDSETVEVSAIGDILGPTTANLDSLIRMPFGCGEQNMLNFVPNIVISKYLKRTRRSTPIIESKARSFSEIGYQKEMTYRHKDGSFSAFGESDKSGSTWLTAFVAKSFELARSAELVQVEPRVVDEALAWLAKQQSDNGSFLEVGTVSHRDMQGGAAKGLALTAYVLTAFLQSQDSTYKHQDTVKKTLEYLVSNLDSLDDPYAVAITTHALHVASHPAKDKAFKLLESKASNEGGYRFWSKAVEADKSNPFWSQPNSVNVEMTSYALMTYISRGLLDEALPIMQWLVSQRNSNGGFASTQDTVVGLQALASMAELISFPLGDMRVQFKYAGSPADDTKGAKEATMVVNSKTSMVFQKEELPRHVREVEVAADGAGFALAQVSWSYNEDTVGKHPLFNLKVHVDKNTATNLLALKVCTSFIGGRWGNESNMAVVEVTLPSGFTADQEALADLKANDKVKRVETKDQDTVIVLYFDKMETKEYCTDVSAVRTHLVSNQKPVPVTVYDYYDQSRRARVFYEAPPVDLIDKQH